MSVSADSPVFRPTYRLVLYCVAVGLVGAVAALTFDALVEIAQHLLLERLGRYQPPAPEAPGAFAVASGLDRLRLPLVLTLGGLLSGWVVYRWAPEAEGHGTDAVIGAYLQRGGEVRGRIPVVKAISSALTIGAGGVAGREGPTAQISVGVGSALSRWLGLRGQERRSLLLASMAAGLAAMFRAPLGMAIFSVEILYSGMVFESEALIYTVIAAVTSYAFYGLFSGWSQIFTVPENLHVEQPAVFLAFALLGLLAGVVGALLPALLYKVRDLFRRLPGPPHIRPAIGALAVGSMALLVPELLGTGYGWIELAILGQLSLATVLLLLLLKAPAMALTIGSGGSGGVFGPTLTIGGMLGAAVGMLVNGLVPNVDVSIAGFVVVGMASVFAGAARAPISTLIMVAEMTGGYALIAPAMLANILAFLLQRTLTQKSAHPTLYESQVETREDSPLHRGVFLRRAMEMVDTGDFEPTEMQLPRLLNLLRFGEAIRVSESGDMLVTVEVQPGSRLDGESVADTLGRVRGLTAVAVVRGQEVLAPRGDTFFRAGDQLLAMTHPEVHSQLLDMVGVRPPTATPIEP